MNSAFVGYEELGRSWRVLSTSADNRHNTLLDRPNSSFPTQPNSLIPNYIIHWLIFARFYSFPSRGTKSEGGYMRSSPAEHHGLNLPIPQNLVITRPYSGVYPSRCLPIQVEYFLKLSADYFWSDRRLKYIFFKNSYEICCVYVTMASHY